MVQTENSFGTAAAKSGMDEKTARKYCRLNMLPSEIKQEHPWRTRKDPFEEEWPEIKAELELIPGLEAKTLFEDLQRRYPGRSADGQLRTLQRRIKFWRAAEGPAEEVFFPQEHTPGQPAQSDFTCMNALGVTIAGKPFDHLLCRFVLTCSNWEAGTICFSESFESLSEGLQNALRELGGAPRMHRTDCMTTAVRRTGHPDEFTGRYTDLPGHYGLVPHRTNPGSPHENGDAEQRRHRFKRAVGQSLLLRGSREFTDRKAYGQFLCKLFQLLNAGRRERFLQEQAVLHRLPDHRSAACKKLKLKVGPGSTIRVNRNVYSVHSRLIGERIEVKLYADNLEIRLGQRRIEILPRLRGEGRQAINYRHIIDSLIRKPGAFENYRYRSELFPAVRFRTAYDQLKKHHSYKAAARQYLSMLHSAARDSGAAVDDALRVLIGSAMEITYEQVKARVKSGHSAAPVTDVQIAAADLYCYDELLEEVNA